MKRKLQFRSGPDPMNYALEVREIRQDACVPKRFWGNECTKLQKELYKIFRKANIGCRCNAIDLDLYMVVPVGVYPEISTERLEFAMAWTVAKHRLSWGLTGLDDSQLLGAPGLGQVDAEKIVQAIRSGSVSAPDGHIDFATQPNVQQRRRSLEAASNRLQGLLDEMRDAGITIDLAALREIRQRMRDERQREPALTPEEVRTLAEYATADAEATARAMESIARATGAVGSFLEVFGDEVGSPLARLAERYFPRSSTPPSPPASEPEEDNPF